MICFIISPFACCHICKHQYYHSIVHQLYRWWPALHYQALRVKLISVRVILHVSMQSQALPRRPWTFWSLKWNYSPRLQKPTRHYISCSWYKQTSSSNATAVIILIELSDDNKTASAIIFSWLLYEDFIVLNGTPVLPCVSVNLAKFRKGNLRTTWQ